MMNEDKLAKLQQLKVPKPSDSAHREALNAALREFYAAGQENEKNLQKNLQGISDVDRLKDITTQKRRTFMSTIKKILRPKYIGYGALGLLAISLVPIPDIGQQTSGVSVNLLGTGSGSRSSSSGGGQTIAIINSNMEAEKSTADVLIGRTLLGRALSGVASDYAGAPIATLDALSGIGADSSSGTVASAPNRMQMAQGQVQQPTYRQESARQSSQNRPAEPAVNDIVKKTEEFGRVYPAAPMVEAEQVIVQKDDDAAWFTKEGNDKFEDFDTNSVKRVINEPVSTFSIDVDTASYNFVKASLNNGVLPQKDSVRLEELINYFDYNYPLPETREQPFKPSVAVYPTPWNDDTKLMHIGIKGFDIAPEDRPRSNLVFLLDVSGSMNSSNKLPLVKQSMNLLLDTLRHDDTVAITVYAGSSGTVLPPTPASQKEKIMQAIHRLHAGGGTAGAAGINEAYRLAEQNFDDEAINRVILATDGDFNVGVSNVNELESIIERKREKGIYLSVLGFGMGNYNDHIMQTLAQKGNGNASYIASIEDARKVLVDEATSTLFPIANDVKIQVEFNPAQVAEYRLIGYETRMLKREDFNNDKIDAGDIGAGHTVTALYEITPVGSSAQLVDNLRYQGSAESSRSAAAPQADGGSTEYAFLKMRYKRPGEKTSNLLTQPIDGTMEAGDISETNSDIRFAAAVAAFGQILRGGEFTGSFDYDDVEKLAKNARGEDPFGYRSEFLTLVHLAKSAR